MKEVCCRYSIWRGSCLMKDNRAFTPTSATFYPLMCAYSLMGTVVSPNVSTFTEALDTLVQSFTINQALADAVLASGLWNTSDEFSPCTSLAILC